MKFVLAFSLACGAAPGVAYSQTSTIDVPIIASLRAVEQVANGALETRIVSGSEGRTCVEPERACTKVPEFRGLKMTMRNRCVEVTPRIDCTLDQRVDRVGDLRLAGEGGALSATQTLDGSATVRGRGEIGRHIRETAEARATVTVTMHPLVNPDWTIGLSQKPELAINWHSTPRARLFNLFDVTFQSDAERAMREALDSFDFNGELRQIDLKSNIAPFWEALQAPMPIEMPVGEPLYLAFRPESVAIASPSFDADQVRTSLLLAGQFAVFDEMPEIVALPLPDQSETAGEGSGLDIAVPLSLSMERLTEMVNANLPARETFLLMGRQVDVELLSAEMMPGEEEGRIAARIMALIPTRMRDLEVSFEVSGRPFWDDETRILSLADPEIVHKGGFGFGARRIANALLERQVARDWMATKTSLDLGEEIGALEASVNDALTREQVSGVKTRSQLTLTVTEVGVNDTLDLVARARGPLSVDILSLN